MPTKLIDIRHQTGLFAKGPAPAGSLRTGRASMSVMCAKLGAMATSGIFTYDAAQQSYALPAGHAQSLTGAGARNISPMSGVIDHFGRQLPKLVRCFREGGGIPYAAGRTSPVTWTPPAAHL